MISRCSLWDSLITDGHWVPTECESSKAEGRGDNRDVEQSLELELRSLTWMIRLNGSSWNGTDSDIIFIGKRDEDSRRGMRFFIHGDRLFRIFEN